MPVSYTHLDVYKRQVFSRFLSTNEAQTKRLRERGKKHIIGGRKSACRIKISAAGRGGKRRKRMVPQDPVMLLSFLNLKLRDFYGSLDALCEDLDLNREEILEKMKQIDYAYDEENNRFV